MRENRLKILNRYFVSVVYFFFPSISFFLSGLSLMSLFLFSLTIRRIKVELMRHKCVTLSRNEWWVFLERRSASSSGHTCQRNLNKRSEERFLTSKMMIKCECLSASAATRTPSPRGVRAACWSVQSIDPDSAGFCFLILQPGFSQR